VSALLLDRAGDVWVGTEGGLNRWQAATGSDYFLLRLRHAHSGGPPHAKIMEAIKLFGEQVIPHCR